MVVWLVGWFESKPKTPQDVQLTIRRTFPGVLWPQPHAGRLSGRHGGMGVWRWRLWQAWNRFLHSQILPSGKTNTSSRCRSRFIYLPSASSLPMRLPLFCRKWSRSATRESRKSAAELSSQWRWPVTDMFTLLDKVNILVRNDKMFCSFFFRGDYKHKSTGS